ncbi:hypothetical protein BGS_0317 [Beggiatoa sp. SS]|nr:hypothetical protein BGS_0317 [Beggiatoa sp. SS]
MRVDNLRFSQWNHLHINRQQIFNPSPTNRTPFFHCLVSSERALSVVPQSPEVRGANDAMLRHRTQILNMIGFEVPGSFKSAEAGFMWLLDLSFPRE